MAFFLSDKNVKEISIGDYDLKNKKIKKMKDGMILLYSSYCGHCTQIKPEWSKFGSKNKGKVCAMQMDDSKNNQLINILDVTGIPDIRYVNSDGSIDDIKYSGDRTVVGFQEYLDSKKVSKKNKVSKKKETKNQDGGKRKRKRVIKKKKRIAKKKKIVRAAVKKDIVVRSLKKNSIEIRF